MFVNETIVVLLRGKYPKAKQELLDRQADAKTGRVCG
jgi:hypothetical protein